MKLKSIPLAFLYLSFLSCKPAAGPETSEALNSTSPSSRQPVMIDLKVNVLGNGEVIFKKGLSESFIGKLDRIWADNTINAFRIIPQVDEGCGTLTLHFLDKDNEAKLLKGAMDVSWSQPESVTEACLVMQTYTGRYRSSGAPGRAYEYATKKILSLGDKPFFHNATSNEKLMGTLETRRSEGRGEDNSRTGENFMFKPESTASINDCGYFHVIKLSLENSKTYWNIVWDADLLTKNTRSQCSQYRDWEGLYSVMN